VTTAEIIKIVSSSPAKHCSHDRVPTWLVKCTLPLLASICNASMTEGVFPDARNHAIVRPLLKKPMLDPAELSLYHLIFNLSFCSPTVMSRVRWTSRVDEKEYQRHEFVVRTVSGGLHSVDNGRSTLPTWIWWAWPHIASAVRQTTWWCAPSVEDQWLSWHKHSALLEDDATGMMGCQPALH